MNGAIRAVRSILVSDASLADYYAAPVGVAIREGYAGDVDAPPYVLIWLIVDRPETGLAGPAGLNEARIQCDFHDRTSHAAAAAAAYGVARLESFARGNRDDVDVIEIVRTDARQRNVRDREGDDNSLSVASVDFRVIYRDRRPPSLPT